MKVTRIGRLTISIVSGLAMTLVLALAMLLGGGAGIVFAEDQPDGSTITPIQTINGTWGPGTITATADVVIQAGVVITIAPNTTILVADGVGITIDGNLHSDGPVTFTGISATPGAWEGITYADGSSGNLNQATIEYAEHALTLDTLNPISVTNSILRYNRQATTTNTDAYGAGLTIMRGDHVIDHTDIHHNSVETTFNGAHVYGGGMDIQGGNPKILYSRIYENSASTATDATTSHGGGGGILIRGGSPLIQYSEITSNTLYTRQHTRTHPGAGAGIGIYANTGAEIRNNWIANNVNTSRAASGGGIGFRASVSANIIDSNVISGNAALHSGYAGEGRGIDDWGASTFTASNNWIYGNTTNGVELSPGSGSWSSLSDREVKANMTPVDESLILLLLAELSISTWNYTGQDPSVRHIGPMAQDFYAAFGVGEDDRHISTVDADGVVLAAIQGLYQLVQEKNAQIVALEARVAALEQASKRGSPSPCTCGQAVP